MRESGKKRRTAHFHNAPLPPLRRSPFPEGEGCGDASPEIIIAIASYFC